MRHLLKLLLVLFCLQCGTTSLFAARYLSKDDAEEGIRLGGSKAYPVDAVGQIGVSYKDKESGTNANGFLTDPKTLICPAHIFRVAAPHKATVAFFSDPHLLEYVIKNARALGLDPLKSIVQSVPHELSLGDVLTTLDLKTLEFHPTQDIVKAELKRPLPKVPILTLAVERPICSTTGHLISYAPISMDGASHQKGRHVSALEVSPVILPRMSDGASDTFLVLTCLQSEDGTLSLSPRVKAPELFAFPHEGDSGAPLIHEGKVVGIVQGAFEDSATKSAFIIIVPLSPLSEWIKS